MYLNYGFSKPWLLIQGVYNGFHGYLTNLYLATLVIISVGQHLFSFLLHSFVIQYRCFHLRFPICISFVFTIF